MASKAVKHSHIFSLHAILQITWPNEENGTSISETGMAPEILGSRPYKRPAASCVALKGLCVCVNKQIAIKLLVCFQQDVGRVNVMAVKTDLPLWPWGSINVPFQLQAGSTHHMMVNYGEEDTE